MLPFKLNKVYLILTPKKFMKLDDKYIFDLSFSKSNIKKYTKIDRPLSHRTDKLQNLYEYFELACV